MLCNCTVKVVKRLGETYRLHQSRDSDGLSDGFGSGGYRSKSSNFCHCGRHRVCCGGQLLGSGSRLGNLFLSDVVFE